MADEVALVLAGGGARGAYEMGALSVLLPALEERGERPRVLVGTSVGAFNAAFAAGHAHEPLDRSIAESERIWATLRWRDVMAPLVSLRGFLRYLRYAGRLLWVKQPRIDSLLQPEGIPRTLARMVSFDQLERNVDAGEVATLAVTTTSALTSRTVVFHRGGPAPPRDEVRGIDYVTTGLTAEHVRASGAIPALFPAVHVDEPEGARGWYFDGGTRLNTPIKPALELGARKVVVIGLNSIAPGPEALASEHKPDLFEGAAQVLDALIVDSLEEDVRELARENLPGEEGELVPYIFVSPESRESVGELACRIWRERYSGARGFLCDPDISTLGRFTAAGNSAVHGELMSVLFFAPEFLRGLMDMGRRDAQAWLDAEHDDGPWQRGPLPG